MPEKINVIISIEITLNCYEDKSGLTNKELSEKIYNIVELERNELAKEARIAGILLLAGEYVGKPDGDCYACDSTTL